MKQLQAPASPLIRARAFIDQFHLLPNDADIEISLGMDDESRPALLINLGTSVHALLVSEARKVADIMEDVMNAHPNDPEAKTLPNIIMALRAACTKADRGFAANQR